MVSTSPSLPVLSLLCQKTRSRFDDGRVSDAVYSTPSFPNHLFILSLTTHFIDKIMQNILFLLWFTLLIKIFKNDLNFVYD
jgi:hypothetical protein